MHHEGDREEDHDLDDHEGGEVTASMPWRQDRRCKTCRQRANAARHLTCQYHHTAMYLRHGVHSSNALSCRLTRPQRSHSARPDIAQHDRSAPDTT
eukprot:1965462-Rhodomonas_salina.1